MPYQDIATVNINLQTTTASQVGFGVQTVVDANAWFRERSKSYGSLTAAAVDIPSTADAYKALEAAFAQSPQPSAVKVGRRESTTTLTPSGAVDSTTYAVTITVNDGDAVTASYAATVPTDDEEAICTALKTQIDAVTAVTDHVTATVVGSGSAGVLTLVAVDAASEYAISTLTEVTATFATTEAAADVITAIETQDPDFYFVTSTDHTEAFILAMAVVIEAKKKIYFVAVQDELVLATIASPATDTLGKLFDLNYLRTVGMYHQTADTTFPECAFIAKWSTATPGTVAWYAKTLAGVASGTALNGGSTASPLTLTQKDNLIARNSNFTETARGVSVVYGGQAIGGEWIDVVRSKDYIEDQTEVAIFNLKLNSPKVPFDDDGIAAIESVCTSTWNRFISLAGRPNILVASKPYDTNFPAASEVSFADKSNRVYTASATLYLAGAIRLTTININLTYLQ